MNYAIEAYYNDLLENDDTKEYEFLYQLYNGTHPELLSDDKFEQSIIQLGSNLDADFQQYINLYEEIYVDISFDDIKNYLNDNEKVLLASEPDPNNYNYEYTNTFENLEYVANYNYFTIGKNLCDKLRLRNPEKVHCKLGLYNATTNEVKLPFITNYTTEYTMPDFHLGLTNPEATLNVFKDKTYFRLTKSIPAVLGNISLDYLKEAFRKSKFCYYSINDEQFYILTKTPSEILPICKDVCHNGLLNPLPMGVNKDGKFVDLAQCNTGYMMALYLQLPYIPVILYYNVAYHYTEVIDAIKTDKNSLPYANEFCNPYIFFNVQHTKEDYEV